MNDTNNGVMGFAVGSCFTNGCLSEGTIAAVAAAIFDRFTDEIGDRAWDVRIPSQRSFTRLFSEELRRGIEATA